MRLSFRKTELDDAHARLYTEVCSKTTPFHPAFTVRCLQVTRAVICVCHSEILCRIISSIRFRRSAPHAGAKAVSILFRSLKRKASGLSQDCPSAFASCSNPFSETSMARRSESRTCAHSPTGKRTPNARKRFLSSSRVCSCRISRACLCSLTSRRCALASRGWAKRQRSSSRSCLLI